MCYGDPFYGRDGYALRMLEEQMQQEYEEQHARLQQEQILEEGS